MKNALWVIGANDFEGKSIKIVTNDFTLSAQRIGDIYRNRWQMEIFFKWINKHLFIKRFYRTGEQAEVLHLYIALTTTAF